MPPWKKRIFDFHSNEINRKFFSNLQNKSVKPTKHVFILSLICKIEVGSKFDKKLMINLWFKLAKKLYILNPGGKGFL